MQDLIEYINSTEILGFSLDIFAHFFVGMIFTIFGLVLRLPFGLVLFLLFGIELTKEVDDYLTFNSPIEETLKDFFFTFLYPLLLAPVRFYLHKEKFYS